MILNILRYIRHRSLKRFSPFFFLIGSLARFFLRFFKFSIKQKIGSYGPFYFDNYFSFSNFSEWGKEHNNGFEACVEACRNKKCFVDIGAHIGLVSLPVSSVLKPNGKIIAFEPSKANFLLLKRHIKLNDIENKFQINKILVGNKNNKNVCFFDSETPNGMNSIIRDLKPNLKINYINQVTLDSFFKNLKYKPDVIKIDVEGAEIDVLKGSQKILKKYKPIIFLSVHPKHLKILGYNNKDLEKIFKDINYNCYNIDGTIPKELLLSEYMLKPK